MTTRRIVGRTADLALLGDEQLDQLAECRIAFAGVMLDVEGDHFVE